MRALRNAITLIGRPDMARAYLGWCCGGQLRLPWGATVAGFPRFSDFWGARGELPTIGEQAYVGRVLAEGGTAFDVGANLGVFTTLMIAKGARVVHAFEPHPTTFS